MTALMTTKTNTGQRSDLGVGAPTPMLGGKCASIAKPQHIATSKQMTLDDCMFSAIILHMFTHLNSEANYIRKIRRKSPDRDATEKMLIEFNVWKGLSAHGRRQFWGNFGSTLEDFNNLGWAKILNRTQGWGHKKNTDKGMGSFASGISKALWFGGAHKLPMFDRFTKRAMGVGSGTAVEQAKRFYEAFDHTSYKQLHSNMTDLIASSKLPTGASAERIIDKALMLRGIEKTAKSHSPFLDQEIRESYREVFGMTLAFNDLSAKLTEAVRPSFLFEKLEHTP